ncbi:MAG: C4-type zinc ribbon domain-containing protein [Nitrospirota bacterium]
MKEQLERLIALQEADLRLEELAERKRRIPEMVEAARQPLQAAQALRDSTKQAFETTGKERKSCEQELAVQEQVISKLQDRTTKGEIKTNREYQAHLLEVELTKKKRGEIEEQLLILMDAVDAKKKELAQAEAAAKEADQRFNAEKTALESSVGALDEELAGLRQKREALVAAVEPSLLRSYEKLKSSKKGQALAGVNKDGSCMSCRLQVQPQVVAEVKRATSILTCSYCNRILYWAGDPVQIVAIPEKPVELLEVEEAAETTE